MARGNSSPRARLQVHYVNPRRIFGLHEIRRAHHFRELVARMRKHGWQGRPLLVERLHGGHWFQAWTGTHRLAAAKAAGLTVIPVVFANGGRPARRYATMRGTTDDPSRLRLLQQRRDPTAAIMRAEIRINAAADRAGVL